MSVEFAYRFSTPSPRSSQRDLDAVVLRAPVTSDDGAEISEGTRGTVLSVHNHGESYAVEFDQPDGAVATVLRNQIDLVRDAALTASSCSPSLRTQ